MTDRLWTAGVIMGSVHIAIVAPKEYCGGIITLRYQIRIQAVRSIKLSTKQVKCETTLNLFYWQLNLNHIMRVPEC